MKRRVIFATSALLLGLAPRAEAQLWQQPAAGAQAAPGQFVPQTQPNAWGNMQAGGLAPPAPLPGGQVPGSGETAQRLDASKQADSGRKLEWVWVEAEGGFEHTGLETFNAEGTLMSGFVNPSVNGGMAGAGVGGRLLFFTLGARGRASFFSAYQRFSIGPEIGVRLPIGKLEPHFALGAGYTTLAHVKDATGTTGVLGAKGYDVRASGGLDYFLLRYLSVGLGLSWELLGLSRPALDGAALAAMKASPGLTPALATRVDRLGQSASSQGSALAVSAVIGGHF
ncbi:MAG: hypothetical protein U0359_24705 [Byssovorax sp.]